MSTCDAINDELCNKINTTKNPSLILDLQYSSISFPFQKAKQMNAFWQVKFLSFMAETIQGRKSLEAK